MPSHMSESQDSEHYQKFTISEVSKLKIKDTKM